ncbi:helix-turn-helix domain-containing protein [Paenibacillus beijingensis]|uniref:HTH araC/xylS-type domain-containing protein n=1 Tax=Paenibacillus beijingensis TaxID=1126833 RepID=A0A0D5NH80_9BACL|nr:helix-turn-helix domain-containing protein [Paenibacillus beijingensis]AJY74273.1 hypothetical protein VN24_06365 [Paenibacillus beijingensis]
MEISISGKVMLVYGVVFLTVIILTFWLSYIGTMGTLERDLNDTNSALLQQVDQRIEVVFRQTEKDLLNLTNDIEFVYFIMDSYKDDAQKYNNFYALNTKLTDFIRTNPDYSSIYVYSDKSGDILTDKSYIKNAAPESNWLKPYLNMSEYFKWLPTHQAWDGSQNHNVITLVRSYPAISSPGFRKGLVAVNINEKVVYNMVKAVYEDRHAGHLMIVDKEGKVVTHDDKTQLFHNMNALPYIKRVLSEKENGFFTVDLDGVRQTVFYRTSEYTGWKMISIIPESKIYEPLNITRNLLVLFACLMIALGLAALFYVNRWTFRPLERLIGKVSSAYTSDPSHPQSWNTAQLGYLETVFDQMVIDRDHLAKHLRDSKPMLKWKIIMDILTGFKADYQSVSQQLEFVGAKLYEEWFLVCTAEIEKEGATLSPRDESLFAFAFCNVAEELINTECAGAAIDLGGGRAAVVISFAEGDADQNHLRTLALLEQVLDIMKRQFGIVVTVGVGTCFKEMKDIPLSYTGSQKALRYKMVFGQNSVISIEDLLPSESQHYYRLSRFVHSITDALKKTDMTTVRHDMDDMFRAAVESSLEPELIRQLSFELILKSLYTVESLGIEQEPSAPSLSGIYEKIGLCDNWKEAERLVYSVLEELSAKIEEKRSHRGKNETIERMTAYIQEHYQESELSLDLLAEQFHISPAYISRLFKEYTENNFIDYLIQIRINASKALLLEKDRKVNDIAEKVGYANSRSFLRTFKKYTGMTPSEYRKMIVGSEK